MAGANEISSVATELLRERVGRRRVRAFQMHKAGWSKAAIARRQKLNRSTIGRDIIIVERAIRAIAAEIRARC